MVRKGLLFFFLLLLLLLFKKMPTEHYKRRIRTEGRYTGAVLSSDLFTDLYTKTPPVPLYFSVFDYEALSDAANDEGASSEEEEEEEEEEKDTKKAPPAAPLVSSVCDLFPMGSRRTDYFQALATKSAPLKRSCLEEASRIVKHI